MPVEFKVQNQSDDSEDSDEADFEEGNIFFMQLYA